MLSFRSRGTSRLKKARLGADDLNDVRSSIDNASTTGSFGTRTRRSMSLKERFGFRPSPKIKGPEGGSGSASGMGKADCGKSGNDNRDPASRELLVKRSEDYQGNNNAAVKSAGVYGHTTLKHSWEDNVNETATVKYLEDGDNFEDGNDKNKCDLVDKRQGSGSDSGRAAADPDGTSTGREAGAENKTSSAVGPSINQLTGTTVDFGTPPYPPQRIATSPCERFPPRPLRPPGLGQPVNSQLRRLPLRAPPPTAGPAFRAPSTSGTYPPSNLRTYSAASTASSSATMTPAMYSRRNFPVENRQMQYPPRRFHHPRQPPPPQQSAYYQSSQRPGPIRSGGGFPQSYSSSSSAKTGNSSSSPTTQSLESTESPPPLEPKDPSTKSSSEEFVTPSQTPNLEQARASPGPYYSRNHGPPNSQTFVEYPLHPYPLQQRTTPRPLKSPPFFHEGLYFAQVSYNTTPEELMAGPELSCVQYPPFHLAHLDCMTQHKVMHKVHNLHHSVPCMTCKTMGYHSTIETLGKSDDPAEYRFVCGWCAIRICAGCRDELRLQGNRLMALLRVVQEREERNALGDPNAPSQLNIEMQPRAPKMGNAQLPVDLSALTPAASAEEISNLSHFGPPGFSGGSAPISRPGTGSSESETGGAQRRFEEYDGEPCWPPPARGRKCLTLDQRTELTNIEEYPQQRIYSYPPIEPSGVNLQRKPSQHLPDPLQWNQRGPTPQPRAPFVAQRRSPADSPKLGQESDGEPEVPVGSTDGKQTQQKVQLPHQEPPQRQSSPLLQVPPPQEPSPRQPSQSQREPPPRSTLRVIEQHEAALVPPPKSPRHKESPPPIPAPTISVADVSGMLRVDEPEGAQPKVMQPGPEAKQTGIKKPVSWAQVEELEVKLPGTKQQPTPKLDGPRVEEKRERRAESPLPSPRPQRESTPRLDKSSRSTPSPRPGPIQATKVEEKSAESSPVGRGMPQPVKKMPQPVVVKPEPTPQPIPKRAEPVLAIKQEKSLQLPTEQGGAFPEPPKLVKNMSGFTISKPVTPPQERPVYPTKPEPNIDLSYYNLKPATTQERYKLPDSMQLPEIDFGGTLDTMAMTDGILGRAAGAHDKPPAAPIRLGGEEREGSISGSTKDKKKWRLPGFGKKVGKG